MEWLNKLLRRRGDHEQWLKEHPGKGSLSLPSSTEAQVAEQAKVRATMEAELATDAARNAARNATAD